MILEATEGVIDVDLVVDGMDMLWVDLSEGKAVKWQGSSTHYTAICSGVEVGG